MVGGKTGREKMGTGGNREGGKGKEVGMGRGEKKGQEEGRFHRWI